MPAHQEFPGPCQPSRKAGTGPPSEAPLLSWREALVLVGFLACVGMTIVSLEFWAARPARFRLAPGAVSHPFLTPMPPALRGVGMLDASAGLPTFTADSP